MYDSEVLTLRVYEQGVVTHEYVSEMRHVGHVEETGDGFFRVVDGVSYRLDDPAAPSGPRGADPDRLTPFGVDAIDRVRLGRLLVSGDQYIFADQMHADVIEALNLDPTPLTTAYRWVEREHFIRLPVGSADIESGGCMESVASGEAVFLGPGVARLHLAAKTVIGKLQASGRGETVVGARQLGFGSVPRSG